VIVITALNDQATALKALKLGAKAFVGKPFNPDKLNDALNKVSSK
jgi:DNA-binding NtrC family response regulator